MYHFYHKFYNTYLIIKKLWNLKLVRWFSLFLFNNNNNNNNNNNSRSSQDWYKRNACVGMKGEERGLLVIVQGTEVLPYWQIVYVQTRFCSKMSYSRSFTLGLKARSSFNWKEKTTCQQVDFTEVKEHAGDRDTSSS